MNTAVINVKIDPIVKKRAQKLSSDLGLSLSSLINAYLKQLIKTKTVTFSAASEEPTKYFLESLRESEADIKAGRVSPAFDNAKDAIAWLNKSDKKYKSQIQSKIS